MSLYDDYKLAEMILPTSTPKPPRGTLGAAATDPVFLDDKGQPITSIACGGSYTFDVPGRSQIWLTMFKDNTKVYDALFSVPMPSYVSSCANDPGTYQVIAYDPQTGIVIGKTTFTVLPATGAGQAASSFLSQHGMLVAGLVAAFLLLRKKR